MSNLDIDHNILANMTESDIPTMKLGLANLKVTIIDYTIARCILPPPPPSQTTSSEPEIAYDPMNFVSTLIPSDASKWEDEIQQLAYLKCKAAVEYEMSHTTTVATANNNSKWQHFVPRTNVVWLSYLLRAMARRAHGRSRKYHVVKGSSAAATKLQRDMWDVLEAVEDVLCGADPDEDEDKIFGSARGAGAGVGGEGVEVTVGEVERTPASAREFLGRAVEEGWVGREELEALKARLEGEC